MCMHLLCELEHVLVDPNQKRDGRLRTADQGVGNDRLLMPFEWGWRAVGPYMLNTYSRIPVAHPHKYE